MTDAAPIAIFYNLGRLGQSGDEVLFAASEDQRVALAQLAGVLAVTKFEARIVLTKLAPNRFALSCALAAEITQACVVTLESVFSHISSNFARELHFMPQLHRKLEKDVAVSLEDDDAPEEIDSLHYDLAGPLLEEFVLGIDPYPRAPGVEFTPPEPQDQPESPFAVLKTLKSGPKSTK